MQIWQTVSLSLLPTVTAKCQSYSRAQQVFHYFQLSCYFWIAGSFALVLVTSYFIMANVFLFGQPQEAQPARRHAVSLSLHQHMSMSIFMSVFHFVVAFLVLSICIYI